MQTPSRPSPGGVSPSLGAVALVAILAACALLGSPAVAQDGGVDGEAPPNIVFLLADDMGYGDVQALNPNSSIETPHLNRLAAEGMTFTDAHTPSAVCTPTRYGLLTGRYCWRSRLKSGVLDGYGTPLIEADRPTVATLLQSAGYTCGIVGKWHLGLEFSKLPDGKSVDFAGPVTDGPNDRGFASSLIIPASLDFPPYAYIRDGVITSSASVDQAAQPFPAYLRRGPRADDLKMEDVLDHLAAEATDFIRRGAAAPEPFFLYFPLTAPHKPVLPHPRYRGRTALGPYGDFVVQVDAVVGQVLKAIEQSGQGDRTLVVFTSDNGSFMHRLDADQSDHVDDPTVQGYRPEHHTANDGWRGTKADIWEAGHRVPFFARWPGRVPAGTKCARTICLTDFFATAAEIVSVTVPEGAAEDSYSFLPLLQGDAPTAQRPPVIHHSAAGMFAIRAGDWKLVLGNGSGGREAPRGKPFARPYQLFQLANDPGEQHDCLAEHESVAKRLEAACERIRQAGSPGDDANP